MAIIPSIDQFDTQMPYPFQIREKKADLNALHAIPNNARWSGMRAWVESEQAVYVLACPQSEVSDNTKWVQMWPFVNPAIQEVVFNPIEPTGGNIGDIWFRPNDDAIELWFNTVSDGWMMLGSWNSGSAPTYTSDPSTPNTSALSYLNSTYPNAKPGDQVYKTAGGSRRTWTCYAAGEWSRIDEVIET